MTSNRNAIADYLSYTLISTGENIDLCFIDGEIWANLIQISKIYDEDENTIKTIVTKIFEDDDFDSGNFSKQIDDVTFYAFDIIIQVGFKVKNQNALRFRQWATKLLSEYLIKGFALDDARLKNCGQVFDDDYFIKLQEEYEEIAFSKRSFSQKITDLFATAYDYERDSLMTKVFFQKVSKLKIFISDETSKKIIDCYLTLANKKLTGKIPLVMNDWIYYFNPLFDLRNNSDLESIIENKEYFSKPTYYENLGLMKSCVNPNTQQFENELFEILKDKEV